METALCYKATKTPQLAKLIKRVVEVGWIIIASVFDQGTNNLAAINSFIAETEEDFLKKECSLIDNTILLTVLMWCIYLVHYIYM